MPLSIIWTRCSSARPLAMPVPAIAALTCPSTGCSSTKLASVRFVPSSFTEFLPFDQMTPAALKSGLAPAAVGSSSARIAATSLPTAALALTSDVGV
jgi:hypothetical protein